MKNGPVITFAGHLGFDPELRFTPNGVALSELRVASTPRARVGEEWQDKETLWFTVTVWRDLAESVAQSLSKGDRVVVTGKLLQQSWEREDGSKSSKLVVDADTIAFDLSRAPIKVLRPVREGSSADLMPEKWLDRETGEIVTAPAEAAA